MMINTRDQFTIYFIRPVGMAGPIKIGLSGNPAGRLNVFRAWSPLELEIIGTIPGNWNDEQFLHSALAADHSHGEWFRPSAHVQRVVEQVLAAGSVSALHGVVTPAGNVRAMKVRATRDRNAARAQKESAA